METNTSTAFDVKNPKCKPLFFAVYLESGSSGNAGTLTITTCIATGSRTYKIKVSYIECSNPNRAPAQCVQYFTGVSNTMTTYNHAGGIQLAEQNYPFCLRQEEGEGNFNQLH